MALRPSARLWRSLGSSRPHLTLFTGGPECSLCEVAKDELHALQKSQEIDLTYFNIRDPPAKANERDAKKWRRLYQYDIPVLHLGEKRIQKHRIDPDKVIAALDAWRAAQADVGDTDRAAGNV